MSIISTFWLWHFLYSVSPHPVSSLNIYICTFVVSRAFMAGAASVARDVDSSRAPGLTSGLQGPWTSTVVLYCWCHSDSASVFLYFTSLYQYHKNEHAPRKLRKFNVFMKFTSVKADFEASFDTVLYICSLPHVSRDRRLRQNMLL